MIAKFKFKLNLFAFHIHNRYLGKRVANLMKSHINLKHIDE